MFKFRKTCFKTINRVIFSQSTQCASTTKHRSACSPRSFCCFFEHLRSISCKIKEEIIAQKVAIGFCMPGNELLACFCFCFISSNLCDCNDDIFRPEDTYRVLHSRLARQPVTSNQQHPLALKLELHPASLNMFAATVCKL